MRDGAGGLGVIPPHLSGELRTGERLARLGGERLQQIELKPAQIDPPVVDLRDARVAVDGQASDAQHPPAFVLAGGPSGERLQPGGNQ